MEIKYSVYHLREVVEKDIPVLDKVWKENIHRAVKLKLCAEPELYGVPLRESLHGLWKLRVGAYRVIYQIQGKKVFIVAVGHRSVAYKIVKKRI